MVTETAIPDIRAEYDAALADLVAAGAAGDVALMVRLGAAVKRLENKLNGTDTETSIQEKITARTNAYAAIASFVESSEMIQDLLKLVPTVKTIKINFDGGKFKDVGVVGGFRTVSQKGLKRSKVYWEAPDKFDGRLTGKEVVEKFGSAYGMTKSYAAMEPSERVAILNKIVDKDSGENLTKVVVPNE